MASKTFEFVWNFAPFGSVRETEKAYGFEYYNGRYSSNYGKNICWLPKSQITVEPIEDDGSIWWHEGDCLVSVPMWLARKNDYFKFMLD